MMRAVLAFVAIFAGCRESTPPIAGTVTATPPEKPTPTVTLPNFSDPLDPRRTWLEGLSRPALTRVPGLQWECFDEEETLEVRFGNLKVNCDDVIRQNLPRKNARQKVSGASCAENNLHLPWKGLSCPKEGTTPDVLARWRMPEGFGLYKTINPSRLEPLFPDLPLLQVVEAPQVPSLKDPPFAPWLQNASFQGAIAAVLAPESEIASDLPPTAVLEAFLLKIRAPKFFNPHFSKRPDVRPLAKGTKLPWLTLSTPHAGGMFRDACVYINRWILTRQLTAEPGTIDRTRESRLRCLFVWADQPLPSGALVLAYLPLPLQGVDGRFPFKTVEDSWSPSLFQSLKLENPGS